MQLNTLKPTHEKKHAKRVGRGGVRGKTSGKGHKGQNSRAGTSKRPEWRDTIKKLPKRRGYGKNRGRTVNAQRERAAAVNLSALNDAFAVNDTVTPSALLLKGLVRRFNGRTPTVKILGTGELSKKLTIANCSVSQTAKEAIEKAGGEIV